MIETTGINEITLYVENMESMVCFYRDIIGLRVTYPQNVASYHGEHCVNLWAGTCVLSLRSGGRRGCGEDAPRIVFSVNNIDRARSYLSMRDIEISEVHQPAPWIYRCDGYDPEGNPFSLEHQQIVHDIPSQVIQ